MSRPPLSRGTALGEGDNECVRVFMMKWKGARLNESVLEGQYVLAEASSHLQPSWSVKLDLEGWGSGS